MTAKFEEAIVLRASPPIEAKLDAGGVGEITGIASPYGPPADSYGDIIERGAFRKALASGELPAMLWSHRLAEPIGRWEELWDSEKGLFVRGRLNLDAERGREAFAHLKHGDATGLSIGYRVPPGGAKPGEHGTVILTEIELLEISVVTLPAARRARVESVKALTSRSELEELLRDAGLARAAARKIVDGGWPALAGEPDGNAKAAEELAAKIDAAIAGLAPSPQSQSPRSL